MRIYLALTASLLLTACNNLATLKERKPEANDYAGALASEYLEYADSLAEQKDASGADYFAVKGLKALSGDTVLPDVPAQDVADKQKAALVEARGGLVSIISENMQQVAAQKLARSILLYDCWHYKALRGQSTTPCREEFESSMVTLDDVAEQFAYTHVTPYPLEFDMGSAELSEDAKATIDMIASQLEGLARYKISVKGYQGNSKALRRLTQKRMQAVKAALVKAGGNAARIELEAPPASSKAVYLQCKDTAKEERQITVAVKTITPPTTDTKKILHD